MVATGDIVVCSYRMPSVHQPWIHPIWVGVVTEPGDDPAAWNGRNSERRFCELTGRVRVEYHDPADPAYRFVQHDDADSLLKITDTQSRLTGLDAIREFLGPIAAQNFERAHGSTS